MPSPSVNQILRQAKTSVKRGDLAQAKQLYQSILKKYPENQAAKAGLQSLQSQQASSPGTTLEQALGHLMGLYNQGRFQELIQKATPMTQHYPDSPLLWNILGTAHAHLGDLKQAADCYTQIIRLKPKNTEAHNNLGNVFKNMGQYEAAIQSYNTALQYRPDYAGAHNNLGIVFNKLGRHEEAIQCYNTAVQHQPDYIKAYYNLGNVLNTLGRHEEAIQSYNRVLQYRPDYAEAHNNLGLVFNKLGRHEEAIQCYNRAIQHRPDHAEAHNNLGVAFKDMDRHEEAIQSYNRTLQYRPDHAESHYNLGNAFKELDRYEEAIQSYNRALQYRPDYAETHSNLGILFNDLGRHKEAIQSYNTALQYQPNYAEVHHNLAFALLHQGEFTQGWQEYEWRLKKKRNRELIDRIESYEQDLWNGKDLLQGKTILLHTEQGLGDTIQFCRYAKLLEQQGATVILSVQPPLQRLLQGLSPMVQVVGKALPQQFDTHCLLMSLPYLLQTELDTIPADLPYLFAEPERQARWQALLDNHDYRIGIVWQGNKKHKYDHIRSFPLLHFAGLSSLPGVRLISLQKYEGLEQIAAYRDQVKVEELGEEFDSGKDAFLDSAAIMTGLDLVITPDTATAHLAGALGVPVWVVLAQPSEWRWLEDRTDSPWYPSMRLFRQAESGDWSGVFEQIEQALVSELSTKRQ